MRLMVFNVFVLIAACGATGQGAAIGYRNDGSGAFAEADPPLHFSEGSHVLWKIPMPNWSNCSPIVVNGRVLVTSEPDVLLCIDSASGKILWQQHNDHLDLLSPQEASAAKAAWQREVQFEQDLQVKHYDYLALRKAVEQSPNDHQAKARLEDFVQQAKSQHLDIEDSRGGYDKHSPELREQEKRRGELERKYGLYFDTWRRSDYWIGQSMPTPVSDGQWVWASFGSDTVVCRDMDGKLRWMKWFDKGFNKKWKIAGDPYWNGYPRALFVTSPLLVGDTLIVQAGRAIRGLDAATGQLRWEQDIDRYVEYCVGSPVHVNISGTDVVVTSFGDVRRVSDGTLLASNIGFSPNGTTPAVHGDVVFFENGANPGGQVPNVRYTIEASRLSLRGRDQIVATTLWSAKSRGGFPSPIYHEGLLYHVDEGFITVRDADTGRVLNKPVPIEKQFSEMTLAGKYLIVSDNKGDFTIWTAGPNTEPVATNHLDEDKLAGAKLQQRKMTSGELDWQFMLGSPFFEGGRMYVRSYDNLYCIGE